MKVKDFKKDFGQYMKLYGQRGIECYENGLVTLEEALKMANESYLQAIYAIDEPKEETLTTIMGEEVVITEQPNGTVKAKMDGHACITYENYTFEQVVNKYYKMGFAF